MTSSLRLRSLRHRPLRLRPVCFVLCLCAALLALLVRSDSVRAAEPALQFDKGDHVSYIGNTLADRMQHHAWLETAIHSLFPEHDLTFRNLSFPGDELKTRPREKNFGDPDQWLSKNESDVVFCFFGYNEALKGKDALDDFRRDLADVIDHMHSQQYNGESAPQLVFFSPIAHEDLNSRHLPDGSENNAKLTLYTQAMQEVCESKDVLFVDLFNPTKKLYAEAEKPLTLNGIHLLDHGNRALADVIIGKLFGDKADDVDMDSKEFARLQEAVLDKNYEWFSRYRVIDGYNVFGGRSKLSWFGQSNADVMMREMEVFDVKTANRDKRIQAVARGGDREVKDDNLPELLDVQTNKPGPLEDGGYPYLSGEEAMDKMTVAKGMQVNLFASEEMFPRLVNPVQMAFDTNGHLFASVWPSYPHWNPTQPRRDAIVCLPDKDQDGVADECIVFADKLNSVTGFEFWGGGLLVAALPELWFLKDTDGDYRADVKIRMLQGLSSADSHHSPNAFVLGPDGWLYWSRGIFNVATMETPTQTYRSTKTGVHRFNPRTFEMEFHFPIGPNPHGDVFDQWGYQFANDGTSGRGSYVNIGKGVGNKYWFKKRVRPVAATGILSSSHFPEQNQGNFLICNCIGFLGVLQHEVKYNGADIRAEEVEPILVSDDPNFRPTDVEIGADGALYVADWQNALIGHMQHNIRDPNRDHEHGRIYRVTHKERPLLEPVRLKGKPIDEVCDAFYAKENATRYRARIELSGRDSQEVAAKVSQWASQRDVSNPDDAQALLECLWVFEEHRIPNRELLARVTKAEEPRVRAAAIRVLGHWGSHIDDWEKLLVEAARDESALVRAEAVKSAVEFEGLDAAEVIFEVATRPLDPELQTVLNYAKGRIAIDRLVQESIRSGRELSDAALAYALKNASVPDLLKLDRTEAVYQAVLSRADASRSALEESISGLASLKKTEPVKLLLELIRNEDKSGQPAVLQNLGQLLTGREAKELRSVRDQVQSLALEGEQDVARQIGFAALIQADQAGNNALYAASKSKSSLRDLLAAVPRIDEAKLRGSLYTDVRSLMFELPPNLESEESASQLRQPGVNVEYFYPSKSNVALETFKKMKPKISKVVPGIGFFVPKGEKKDKFALRFTGTLTVPKSGRYTFFTNSDDGSRLYIDGEQIVNNDGLHGMSEKKGTVQLVAGNHDIIVTYFDNGGGDGLEVTWSGPGLNKQKIAPERLSVSGGAETIHDTAIRSLASIPGHESEKFADLAKLIRGGRNRAASISVLKTIPEKHWPEKGLQELANNLVGYLSAMPARLRTGGAALETIALTRSLSKKLPKADAQAIEERLQNLDVRVIAIGTVPARMIYDKEQIVVEAGSTVEFRFANSDHMPHNFVIVQPGSLAPIGRLAEATARDADAKERHYVPVSDKILLSSQLLEPGQSQALTFEVPSKPAVYPYVCTYPGHWRRMFGALYVVEDLEAYQAGPEEYLAASPMPFQDELLKYTTRNTEWTFDDLIDPLKNMGHDRSFEVGKTVFRVANCVACHKMNNEGRELGPDLTKIEPKKHTKEHILRSIVEPSKDINKKFLSNSFLLSSGKVVTGMVVEETADVVKVLVDPLAKAAPVVIEKDSIDQRVKSPVSIMPKGLLNKLTEAEVLDLIAYVLARGDQKHKLFMDHQHGSQAAK